MLRNIKIEKRNMETATKVVKKKYEPVHAMKHNYVQPYAELQLIFGPRGFTPQNLE
jgi:hypothetical protein